MLVNQRIKWSYEYHFGKSPWFPAYLDYKRNRDSESFRLNSALEEFFEYTISLEERIRHSEKVND